MTTTTTSEPATGFAIERTLDLQAAPERVWRAITDPAEVIAWFGTAADALVEVGDTGWFGFGADGRFAVRLEAVEPGTFLAWRWAEEPETALDAGPTSLVDWTLEPHRNGTRLRMRESGLRTGRNLEMNTAGWFEELAELREHLAAEPWERPIRRRLELRADRERVWRALSDDAELRRWWGLRLPVVIEPGWEGWFDFPDYGRHAVRIEVVEPPRDLAWRWTADEPDVPIADVRQPLVTEWLLAERDGGGTTLQLTESGFTGPAKYQDNTVGWTDEVLPSLVRLVDGEAERATGAGTAAEPAAEDSAG
jgi:uncharacterized protein YndB with AHSA1/START domain